MKKIHVPFMAIIMVLSLSGCIAPMGHFKVEPYAKPFHMEVQGSLHVVLKDKIKDKLIVEGATAPRMEVSAFRQSIKDATKKIFDKNFEHIEFHDSRPAEENLTLVLYRIKPYWAAAGSETVAVHNPNGYGGTSTVAYTQAAFKYSTSLFYEGQKITEADGAAGSEKSFADNRKAHSVFKNGLKVTMEIIHKSIFTDEALEKIGREE